MFLALFEIIIFGFIESCWWGSELSPSEVNPSELSLFSMTWPARLSFMKSTLPKLPNLEKKFGVDPEAAESVASYTKP